MRKLILLGVVLASVAAPVFAEDVFSGTATSGTSANPLASVAVSAGATTNVYYVDAGAGTASDKSAAPLQLVKTSNWTFDFSNPAAVKFTGNIVYGDYKSQTNVTGMATIDGRQSYTGVTQAFSGSGAFDAATNTFTYTYMNDKVNGGGASVQTQSSASCANGATSFLGKVCGSFATATPAWEGLTLKFVFAADKSTFSGVLQGTDTSGSGITANSTKINWQISGRNQAKK